MIKRDLNLFEEIKKNNGYETKEREYLNLVTNTAKPASYRKSAKKMQKNKKLNMVAGLICQPGREDLMVND